MEDIIIAFQDRHLSFVSDKVWGVICDLARGFFIENEKRLNETMSTRKRNMKDI